MRDFIPQNRQRVFVVSIRKDIDTYDFKFPVGTDNTNWWDFIDPIDTRECTGRQQRMINFCIRKKKQMIALKLKVLYHLIIQLFY